MAHEWTRVCNSKVVALGASAVLIRFPSGREEWIADSLIHADSEIHRDNTGVLGDVIIAAWKVEQLRNQAKQRAAVDTQNLHPRRTRRSHAA